MLVSPSPRRFSPTRSTRKLSRHHSYVPSQYELQVVEEEEVKSPKVKSPKVKSLKAKSLKAEFHDELDELFEPSKKASKASKKAKSPKAPKAVSELDELFEDADEEDLQSIYKASSSKASKKADLDGAKFLSAFADGLKELQATIASAEAEVQPEPGYTDTDCLKMLREFQDDKESFEPNSPKLYACLRPQPCKGKEKKIISHGREYCTGRSFETVSEPQQLAKTIQLFEQRIDLQLLRKKEIDLDQTMLGKHSLAEMKYNADLEWNQSIEQAQEKMEELESVQDMLKKAPELHEVLGAWKDERMKYEVKKTEALMIDKILEGTEGIDALKSMNNKLAQQATKVDQQLDASAKRLEKLEEKMNMIADTVGVMAGQMGKVHEAAIYSLGEETWSMQLGRFFSGSMYDIVKRLVWDAPIKFAKFLFWEPFKDAFNYWIYDRLKFIWGTFLLVTVCLVLLSLFYKFGVAYPETMQTVMSGINAILRHFGGVNKWWMGVVGQESLDMLYTGWTSLSTGSLFYTIYGGIKSFFGILIRSAIPSLWFGRKKAGKKTGKTSRKKSGKKSMRKTGKKSMTGKVRKTGKKSGKKSGKVRKT